MSDLYHELLLEEARSPQNAGQLATADQVLHGRNASCGDQVTIYLKWGTNTLGQKVVKDLKWQGQGCVISQAAMSVLSGLVKGKSEAEIALITQSQLEEILGIEDLSVGRIKCLRLGLGTLQQKKIKP